MGAAWQERRQRKEKVSRQKSEKEREGARKREGRQWVGTF